MYYPIKLVHNSRSTSSFFAISRILLLTHSLPCCSFYSLFYILPQRHSFPLTLLMSVIMMKDHIIMVYGTQIPLCIFRPQLAAITPYIPPHRTNGTALNLCRKKQATHTFCLTGFPRCIHATAGATTEGFNFNYSPH